MLERWFFPLQIREMNLITEDFENEKKGRRVISLNFAKLRKKRKKKKKERKNSLARKMRRLMR